MAWLLRAQPYDEALPGLRTLYFSDVGFTTEPGDSPANTYWARRIEVPLTVRLALFAGTSSGGRSEVSFGSVVLANADGALDGLAAYDWDGRLVEVLYTAKESPVLADFAVVFSGAAERLLPGDDLEIEVRDLQVLLDEPFQPARFLGTGGAEGPAEYKDRRKPTLLGIRRQFTPVPLDAVNLVWCYHDAPVGGPLAVLDAGVALPFAANYASFAALIAATIPAGQYATCNALGLLRLNAPPSGPLTIDAEGAKPGASVLTTFADIAQHAITRATTLTGSDFASGTVAALNALAAQDLGHWDDGGRDVTLRDVLDGLAESVGAYYGFNDARQVVLGRLDAPAVTPDLVLTDRDIYALRPLPAERRLKTMTVGYGERIQPLRDEEIAGSVTGSARTALIEPWRQESHTDAAVAAASLLARQERLDSAMDDAADALAEAQRRVALHGPRRRAFEVEAVLLPGVLPGITVELRDDRYALSGGARLRVLRVERDAAQERLVLEVWG